MKFRIFLLSMIQSGPNFRLNHRSVLNPDQMSSQGVRTRPTQKLVISNETS